MRRLARALVRRLKTVAGLGLQSAHRLGRTEFLLLFDPHLFGRSSPRERDAAENKLLRHLSQRTSGDWPDLPTRITDLRIDLSELSNEQIVARADAALSFDLHPSGIRPVIRGDDAIDWSNNPAESREWLLMLHRHSWWALWAAAYRINGDEKYARAFVAQITDWIRRNRMPIEKSEHLASWRLMECGLRLRLSWIPAFGCFYHSPAFADNDKLLVLRAIYDHCNFLATFCTNRNHLVRESNGLLAAAIAFPEFSQSGTWLETAIARLDRELLGQVNPDGSHIEMSTGYQWLAVDEFEVTRSLLQPLARTLPRADLEATLERMYEMLAAVMRPDRRFPQLNDGFILWDADRLAAAARDYGRPDLEYVATSGAAGSVPGETSRSFPNAGLHVMRSGWSEDAHYLVFDTGPYGGPHGHEDKLSFELCAFGAPIIVDPGSYTYQPDDPYRAYFVSSLGHNSILVDGASQVRRWNSRHMAPETGDETHGRWRSDDDFDWAQGSYGEGYAAFSLTAPGHGRVDHEAAHTREILFAKPDYWVVADRIDAQSTHEYSALFHLHPDVSVVRQDPECVLLESRRNGPTLAIFPVSEIELRLEVITGRESPAQGWYSADHHRKQPAPTLVFRSAMARSAQFVWVMVPLRHADDVAGVSVSATDRSAPGHTSFELEIGAGAHLSRCRDSIRVSKNHRADGAVNITRSSGRTWRIW